MDIGNDTSNIEVLRLGHSVTCWAILLATFFICVSTGGIILPNIAEVECEFYFGVCRAILQATISDNAI